MIKNLLVFTTLLFTCLLTSAQYAVFFNVQNERTVAHATLGSATAIDIYMHASLAGSYHSRGQIYLRYNIERFGSEIVTNSNVEFEHGALLQGNLNFFGQVIPFYQTINVIDNSSEILALTWQSNFLTVFPTPMAHNSVPDTPTLLYTLYIKNQDASKPSNLELHRQLMSNQQYLLSPTDADNDGNPDEVAYNNGFLPVEFMDFSFDLLADNKIQLNWSTSKEVNNDYFEVEKYMGEDLFLPLGRVAGFGTTDEAQHYHFIDETEMDKSNFYRIKQVDLDGKFTHSPIIEVHFSENTQFLVYPTVTTDFCTIKAQGEAAPQYKVSVINLLGQVVSEQTLQTDGTMGTLELNMSSVNQGLYIVNIVDATGQSYSSRVIKL